MLFTDTYVSPIGNITFLSDSDNLLGLWLEGQKHFGGKFDIGSAEQVEAEPIRLAKIWLEEYFKGKAPDFTPPIKIQGSPFLQSVCSVLAQIPFGQTVTYGTLAKIVFGNDKRPSARAIGSAVGKNPVSIIVPCHRVVAKVKKLGGYDGGIDKKEWLLRLEGAL